MFRRFTTPAPVTAQQPVDDLVAGALPDRVQTAHERLAHQDDPALLEALSERELADARALAELVRDHERNEQRARIQAAADAAERVRRTASELAEREAADLLRAAQAIGEQRRSSSPHAKVARLHQRKPRVLGLLAGVVAFAMLFSAVTVQQNIAPTGGVTNPMWWLSYGLEALISAVLVALMLSTGDTAEWGVIDRLWQVYTVEGVLLTASIALNTFPYIKTGDITGIGIHAIAPIMIGVALVTHRLVAERYGRAIEQATAAVPDHEDLQARLAALTQVGGAANQILPSILTEQPSTARRAEEKPVDDDVPGEHAGAQVQHPGEGSAVGAETAAADPAEQPTEEIAVPAAAGQAGATAAAAGQPPAGTGTAAADQTAAPVPVSAFTELGLAITPPAQKPGTAPSRPAASGAVDQDEAELDARLAAALRQTLVRIRSGEQPAPEPAEPSDTGHEQSHSAAPAPAPAANTSAGHEEKTAAHPGSIAPDGQQTFSAPTSEGHALTTNGSDRALQAEQDGPIAADGSEPAAAPGSAELAPRLTGSPESAPGHPSADQNPSEEESDHTRNGVRGSDHFGDNQATPTDDEPTVHSDISSVQLTDRPLLANGTSGRHL
ncbi:hypothetical protein [Nocardia donostiensis]|uniref:DUF2637 domain-containing protein n=1 Tax=Nocardia donostiensis TaxID=1538463 RepID=A0A1W0B3L5_9NOCA|nr:hypothetical protein [Nocardia donostiensis]ONM50640.1 hypothetical protein B0T46_01725 [Nocardia donostiensis]OQS17133.1 hypothetical protein B0T36_00460 [Nocardia donostiensis]OQS18050.1 hypothetical protein B0T44_21660 [Nocardia donostiensis]